MTLHDPWDGTERRRVDEAQLDKAIQEVRNLRPAIIDLAEAFTIKSETLHKVMVRITILFAVLFAAIFLSNILFVNGLNNHMDEGHNRIICNLNLTPEQKTALGELACK